MPLSKKQLAQYCVARSLFKAGTLQAAIDALGYVQADPIRAPARAQDLILRHRVKNYRVDDLEKKYPTLDIFEDTLHNYGFFPNRHLPLLYPRLQSPHWHAFMNEHKTLRRKVLNYFNDNATVHPRTLDETLRHGSRTNGWGGSSSTTTLMLERLHREGKVRVQSRVSGIRVYELAANHEADREANQRLSVDERADGLIRMMVGLYAPLPIRSLKQLISMMRHYKPEADYAARINTMVMQGEFGLETVDGLAYVWPNREKNAKKFLSEAADDTMDNIVDQVKLLAPFDPIVWDRRRFEHLWGWAYRFEAYTPATKRKLGYYALPILWRENVIGWANVAVENGTIKAEFGYVKKMPREVAFKTALEAEVERFRAFAL